MLSTFTQLSIHKCRRYLKVLLSAEDVPLKEFADKTRPISINCALRGGDMRGHPKKTVFKLCTGSVQGGIGWFFVVLSKYEAVPDGT